MARSTDPILCFDLGGTKLMAALVSHQGRVITHVAKKIDQSAGWEGLLEDFRELAHMLPSQKFKQVSVASAGPLDSQRGVLLDPTNFFTAHKSWGVVPLVAQLKRIFKKPVYLENDAAAAVLGEARRGGLGRSRSRNIVVMTLGTGVGIGVIANGQLVRAGRGLHPEASHIPINNTDKAYPCGCGAYGCIEAYVAGSHFAKRMSAELGHPVTGEFCRQLAEDGDPRMLEAFHEYGQHLAMAIRSMVVTFAPEVVVLSGGFTAGSAKYFLPSTEKLLPKLLVRYREGIDLLPKVQVSKLGEMAGVVGAAFVALEKKKGR